MKTALLNSFLKTCNGESRHLKIAINEADDPYYICCQAQFVAGIVKDHLNT